MSRSTSGDMWVHQPLPYIIVARVVVSEDMASEQHIIRTIAYSALEAMFQVTIQFGGAGVDDAKVKIEHIEPDLAAFASMIVAATRDNVHT